MALYKGYSTLNSEFTGSKLEDIELIKRDLLNNFGIRRGEKLMNANFGTSIQDIIMDPLTEDTKNLILDEIQQVIDYDPRVELQELIVDELPQGNGIGAQVSLLYVQQNQTETMLVKFLNVDGVMNTSSEIL
jgi:phage baseplate assembly protein W